MKPASYDVLIVGGGPAGLAAAHAIKRANKAKPSIKVNALALS